MESKTVGPADRPVFFVAPGAIRHLWEAVSFLLVLRCRLREEVVMAKKRPSPTGIAQSTDFANSLSFLAIRNDAARERPMSDAIRFATPFTVLIAISL